MIKLKLKTNNEYINKLLSLNKDIIILKETEKDRYEYKNIVILKFPNMYSMSDNIGLTVDAATPNACAKLFVNYYNEHIDSTYKNWYLMLKNNISLAIYGAITETEIKQINKYKYKYLFIDASADIYQNLNMHADIFEICCDSDTVINLQDIKCNHAIINAFAIIDTKKLLSLEFNNSKKRRSHLKYFIANNNISSVIAINAKIDFDKYPNVVYANAVNPKYDRFPTNFMLLKKQKIEANKKRYKIEYVRGLYEATKLYLHSL